LPRATSPERVLVVLPDRDERVSMHTHT
jgi:hypothetical protein